MLSLGSEIEIDSDDNVGVIYFFNIEIFSEITDFFNGMGLGLQLGGECTGEVAVLVVVYVGVRFLLCFLHFLWNNAQIRCHALGSNCLLRSK